MKLPSVERLLTGAGRAARRFPAVITCALIAAIAANIMIDASSEDEWLRIGLSASLGLPLFTGLTFLSERHRWPATQTWLARAVGFLVLLVFYWRWGGWAEATQVHRYFHLSATFHLATAAIAYVGVRESNGFWQFNRALFLRFLIGGVFSGVLFVGLAIALAGIDNLFGVDIDENWYFRLWIVIAVVFQTWFFLAGLPDSFQELESSRDYPTGLRVFSQYVLVPLVSVYLVILTAYLGRVILTRTWPSGWIGYLVSALAALGILSLLLVHPERERSEHRWIDGYARVFWFAILPSVAMLLLAIWQRIDQYGITERRYLLTILALWLAATAGFFAVSRSREIKGIPLSLAVVGIFAFLGPWSAYSVARASQVGRLERLFETNGVLVDGRVVDGPRQMSGEDWRQTNDVLAYLFEHHGSAAIDPWFDGRLAAIDTIANSTGPSPSYEAGRRSALIMSHLGLESPHGASPGPDGRTYYTSENTTDALPVGGFDYALMNIAFGGTSPLLVGDSLRVTVAFDGLALDVRLDDSSRLRLPLDPILDRGSRGSTMISNGRMTFPRDSLRLDGDVDGLAVRIYVQNLNLLTGEAGTEITGANGTLLVRVPREPGQEGSND